MAKEIEKTCTLQASGVRGLTFRLSDITMKMIDAEELFMSLDGDDLVIAGKDYGPGIRMGVYRIPGNGKVRAPALWCRQIRGISGVRVQKLLDDYQGTKIIRIRKA